MHAIVCTHHRPISVSTKASSRPGGNKQMVDMLVAAWNRKNPNCRIKLTYIPHTEVVGKIAQGIASGEVPDLMGMDLIYAPSSRRRSSWST
jgi:ABC-type glycerol-3-phosphate transport system substrate-binding protein